MLHWWLALLFFLVKPHRLLKCLTHHISRRGNHQLHKDALDRRELHGVLIYVLQWFQYVKAHTKDSLVMIDETESQGITPLLKATENVQSNGLFTYQPLFMREEQMR